MDESEINASANHTRTDDYEVEVDRPLRGRREGGRQYIRAWWRNNGSPRFRVGIRGTALPDMSEEQLLDLEGLILEVLAQVQELKERG